MPLPTYNGTLEHLVGNNASPSLARFRGLIREIQRRVESRPTTYIPPDLTSDIDRLRAVGTLLEDHLRAYGNVESSITEAFKATRAEIRSLLRRIDERPDPAQYPYAPQFYRTTPTTSDMSFQTYGIGDWANEQLSSPRAREYTNRDLSLEDTSPAEIRRLLRRIDERRGRYQYPYAPQCYRTAPIPSDLIPQSYGIGDWATEQLPSPHSRDYTNRDLALEDTSEPLVTPFGEVETFVESSRQKVWT